MQAWFKKGSGTVVRSTLRAVPATVPDPFLNHARMHILPNTQSLTAWEFSQIGIILPGRYAKLGPVASLDSLNCQNSRRRSRFSRLGRPQGMDDLRSSGHNQETPRNTPLSAALLPTLLPLAPRFSALRRRMFPVMVWASRWRYTARGHKLRFCTMALRGRREPPSQSDGLGGPSYRFPQIVTALSIYHSRPRPTLTRSASEGRNLLPRLQPSRKPCATVAANRLANGAWSICLPWAPRAGRHRRGHFRSRGGRAIFFCDARRNIPTGR